MDVREVETGRYTLRQSILSWAIRKMLVRKEAPYLPITALTEKNVRLVTAQQQHIFLMTCIYSYLQILTAIVPMARD
jgi:hypothetical protein